MNAADYLDSYVDCLFAASEPGNSWPRVIVLDRDGNCEEGYYDQNIISGAWHNGAYASIVLQEPTINVADWTDGNGDTMTQEFKKCLQDDLLRNLEEALEQAEPEDEDEDYGANS